jgi:CBS domain-containing protein
MKKLSSKLLLLLAAPSLALASGGPGPWADGAYYPGGLNGKYVGIVSGRNIAGVLGFAIVDGAPPFRALETQNAVAGDFTSAVAVNQDFSVDFLQNYFAIFVEGRTYTGVTYAGIDIDSKTVSGALQGLNPPALINFTAQEQIQQPVVTRNVTVVGGVAITNVTTNLPPILNLAVDALPIINRGLSGGFSAKIKSKKSVFTFKGDGQLSTPANPQSLRISAYGQTNNPVVPPFLLPPNILTNEIATGVVETHSTPFSIRGIRTSFFANNPAAQQDAQQFSSGGASGGR